MYCMVGTIKGKFCNCDMNRTTVFCSKATMRATQNDKSYYTKLQSVLHKIINRTTLNYTNLQIRVQILLHKTIYLAMYTLSYFYRFVAAKLSLCKARTEILKNAGYLALPLSIIIAVAWFSTYTIRYIIHIIYARILLH